jgi:RNA polymerase sigma factor (sigma-70 family)
LPRFRLPHSAGELSGTSDVDLASRAAGGDRQAFAELTRRAAPLTWSLLRRMGAQPALADDLTQDTMLAALRSVGGYRGEGRFAAWTMRIAARLYLQQLRKTARLHFTPKPIDEHEAQEGTMSHGMRIDLDNALLGLSEAERLCVSLCHGAGYTHEEIADALRMPVGTTKSHVSRGLKKLRRAMLGDAGTEPASREDDDY